MENPDLDSELHARPRVIIVDDNLTTCMVLRAIFQSEFEVLIAQSGEECIELAKLVAPALLLMDIEMPGMSGYAACRAIRQMIDVPVIFVSGHEDLEAHLDALDAGGQDFVLKPFDAKTLLSKTRTLVQQAAAARQPPAATAGTADSASAAGDVSDVLLKFLQSALGSKDLYLLADKVLGALADYGLRGVVQIRHDSLAITVNHLSQEASPLAIAICEQIRRMPSRECGAHFIANGRDVSILALDLPADPAVRALLCKHVSTLVELTQTIAEQIAAHLAMTYQAEDVQVRTTRSQIAVEQLRRHYREVQSKTRAQLEQMLVELKETVTARAAARPEELGQVVDGFIWNLLALVDAAGDEAETNADKLQETLLPSGQEDFHWY